MIAQQLELRTLEQETRKQDRCMSLLVGKSHSNSLRQLPVSRPEGYAAIIFCSIEGAGALHCSNAQIFQNALSFDDETLRACSIEYGGYDVSNDKRGLFQLAFSDAVNFCLFTQEALFDAAWKEDLLNLPEACVDPVKKCRGLRSKMAIHCGDVELTFVPLSGQAAYAGETFQIAKCMEAVCSAGQILISKDVWDIVFQLAERTLNNPQVIDLGSHVFSYSDNQSSSVTTYTVFQLVPKKLARDYYNTACCLEDSDDCPGRVFPALLT